MEIIVEEQLARARALAQTLRIERGIRVCRRLARLGKGEMESWTWVAREEVEEQREGKRQQNPPWQLKACAVQCSLLSLRLLIADTKEGRYNPKMAPIVPVHD